MAPPPFDLDEFCARVAKLNAGEDLDDDDEEEEEIAGSLPPTLPARRARSRDSSPSPRPSRSGSSSPRGGEARSRSESPRRAVSETLEGLASAPRCVEINQ